MVFSSTIFLFLFLPLVLVAYLLVGRGGRNWILLLASLGFYAWGENIYVLLMLASIGLNYGCGILIDRDRLRGGTGRTVLVASVLLNLSLLGFFKYANFLVNNGNIVLASLGIAPLELSPVHLPIGISFFTFQAMSYVIDVYRRDTEVQKNPAHMALYISMFPQLIAGPIVRYHDIAKQIGERQTSFDDFTRGITRFIIGLGKKVLLANVLGRAADHIFSLPPEQIPAGLAWTGAIAYSLQIYFDFSGYSDMAIGLGWIFGFHFLENFNYPYLSRTIREFWRRWHISLSTWFRDYLYIPLGGSRLSPARTYLNLFIVFFLCGLWHGASWTFALWGMYHGCFLIAERTSVGRRVLKALPAVLQHLYAMLVVLVGWVLFRADSPMHAVAYLRAMTDWSRPLLYNSQIFLFLNREFYVMLVLALIGSTPLYPWVLAQWQRRIDHGTTLLAFLGRLGGLIGGFCFFVLVLIYSVASLMGGDYNPFLYFRF